MKWIQYGVKVWSVFRRQSNRIRDQIRHSGLVTHYTVQTTELNNFSGEVRYFRHTSFCFNQNNSSNVEMDGDCVKTLLITANVGSIFEEPETMFPMWLKAFFQCVQTHKPGLMALHCQEVGGKNYEASMQHVNQFIKTLLASEELHRYDRARIFLDEDYTASDKFTALGNLYFIHEEVSDLLLWDFVNCKFIEVEGREVLSGNIENVPIKEKAKFPQYFFPEFKWSRKGFLRTRWSINNCIFDLVNIHLFHDASNIVAMETSPSVYSGNRQRALLHTLQRFENDKYTKVPLFIFGDFNFRLDSNLLIQELTRKLVANQSKGKKGQVNKIDYSEEGNGKIVLTVGSKSFDCYDKHSDLFTNMSKWLQQYDQEFFTFKDRLFEHEINFPPSYPFCEDVSDGVSYMKTRVPSWCDRILLTHTAKDILIQDPSHPAIYDLIGKDVCMGDHKPAHLFVHMKPGKGNCEQQRWSLSCSPATVSQPASERKRTLIINGKLIEDIDFTSRDIDFSLVNIHDNAMFEKEHELIPEFRNSLNLSQSSDKLWDICKDVHFVPPLSEQTETNDPTLAMPTRIESSQEIVMQVNTKEKVTHHRPTRPCSDHHSSSSEDFSLEESEDNSANSIRESQKKCDASSFETEGYTLKNAAACLKDGTKQGSFSNESNNNENCTTVMDNTKYEEVVLQGDFSSNVMTELGESLTRADSADSEVGLSDGCEDRKCSAEGVVLLAQHGGYVHALSSPTLQPHCQPGREEVRSGKKVEFQTTSASSPTGCDSCVVL